MDKKKLLKNIGIALGAVVFFLVLSYGATASCRRCWTGRS